MSNPIDTDASVGAPSLRRDTPSRLPNDLSGFARAHVGGRAYCQGARMCSGSETYDGE